ncbi:MAG: hypothetical protein ACYC7E_01270 [Armatimonadota bacterium]
MTNDAPIPPGQEHAARTIRGTRRWLQAGLGLLWLSIFYLIHVMISMPQGALTPANGQQATPVLLTIFGILTGTVILLIAHLFVVLEPVAFADRGIRVWLSLAFGSLTLLAILPLLGRLAAMGLSGQLLFLGGFLFLLVGVIVLFVLALRNNNRWLLPVALLALLGLAALGGA